MKTTEIAMRLVALCREAKWETAQKELFADDVMSIEPCASEGFSKETKGLAAVVEKGHKFDAMIEQLHSLTVSEPLVASNAIACTMNIDVTMKGKERMQMSEICLYQVKDGKVISEQFFI